MTPRPILKPGETEYQYVARLCEWDKIREAEAAQECARIDAVYARRRKLARHENNVTRQTAEARAFSIHDAAANNPLLMYILRKRSK